jgi:hypothetical protein
MSGSQIEAALVRSQLPEGVRILMPLAGRVGCTAAQLKFVSRASSSCGNPCSDRGIGNMG